MDTDELIPATSTQDTDEPTQLGRHAIQTVCTKQCNVAMYLRDRERGQSGDSFKRRRVTSERVTTSFRTKQPTLLKECAFDKKSVEGLDKIFASAWLSDGLVAVGTKNNKLLIFPASSAGNRNIRFLDIPLTTCDWMSSSIPESEKRQRAATTSCGIHSISLNPSKTRLATGGANACDCAVFNLPTFDAAQLLVGHQDWVFGTAWVSDDHILTASRDATVKLWKVGENGINSHPVESRQDHTLKVRDVKYDIDTQLLSSSEEYVHIPECGSLSSQQYAATLSADATVKLYDPNSMDVMDTFSLLHSQELVSMAINANLVAVGSQSHITLIDVRVPHGNKQCTAAHNIPAVDTAYGVRSLSMSDHVLTSGSGQGRISFLDLRSMAYLPVRGGVQGSGCMPMDESLYLQSGEGYLVADGIYEEHFAGTTVYSASYTHAWDPSGTRLFVGGGPLPYGLRGCYMGIWQS